MIFKKYFSNNKGQVGMTLLMTVITMLFVAGLLVMLYAIIGGELQEELWDEGTSGTIYNETIVPWTYYDGAGNRTSICELRDGTITSLLSATVAGNGTFIEPANYTFSGCNVITTATGCNINGSTNLSYTYTYTADTTESIITNDTMTALAGVPDWFPTIIVLTVVVVLILLIVIIIQNLRASGLMGTGKGA